MKSPSRQAEINEKILDEVGPNYDTGVIANACTVEAQMKASKFKDVLEGTGSLIFDNAARLIYVCLSDRAKEKTIDKFTDYLNTQFKESNGHITRKQKFRVIKFSAFDPKGSPIYHTNVMLAVLAKHVVVCLQSIRNTWERHQVKKEIEGCGKEVIDISPKEVASFCGNVLQLEKDGKLFVVMSEQAYNGFSAENLSTLKSYYTIIKSDISTIERIGGGSARCMLAELF